MFVKGLAASLGLPSLVRAQDAPVDVVVIGAGAAGLAAAQALSRGGRTVTVIEAARRVGGRAHTETETFGFPYDRGCAWLQGPQDMPHVRLAREEGFGLVDADTASEALFHAGRRATAEERAAYWRTWEMVEAGLEEAAGDVAAASLRPADARFLGTVEGWIGALDHGVDFERLSTGDVQGYAELETNYLVRDGLGALVAAQARDVPVVLDTPARRIDWSGNGVRVETPRGTIAARASIVTVSTGVLASGALRFTPDLPADHQDALDAVPMGLLERIGLQFDGPRFDLPANGFLTQLTDALPPAPQCQFSPYQAGQDVIVGFIGGGFGWELARAGPEAAIDFALEEFVRAMGSDARRRFRRGQFSAWATNPLTRGAYSAARPGRHAMRRTLAEPLGERVFFAGEAVAEGRYALMSGAHLSGARLGAQLAGRLNAEDGCTGCGARKSGLKTRETDGEK